MASDQAERVARLFDQAVELPPEGRAAFLDQACAGDDELRREVESLLRADDGATAFLETPAAEAAGDLFQTPAETPPPEHQIGTYRIIDTLGVGGMSVVYRAEQEHPRRTIALKVIKPGLATPATLRRFELEAQVLARLQHPGIAQVYEAGTADTGAGRQPFFAMELIDGLPLNEFADRHQLGTRQRLALLAKVCDAVQHAHQKGIIHRDLKPANILVDQTGQPKVLDFGVARVTDADIQVTTLHTDVGQLVGTIPYMSPEQIAGDPAELDTRSDVYALGVVCYELLAGCLPHDVRHKSIPEAARVIREEDARLLSSANKVFRGDVETIVAKALEKDKSRRYQSVSALTADIRRYLSDEPIAARPPTTIYQLRKFAKRNRALVGGVLAVLAALILGLVGTTWQAIAATQQRREAARQAQVARAVIRFLDEDLLGSVDPHIARGREITVREVFDLAAKRAAGAFPDQPLVAAALHNTIGRVYYHLGVCDVARPHLEQALETRRRLLGDADPDTLQSMHNLASCQEDQAEYDQAEALLRQVLDVRRQVLGPEDPETLVSQNDLALLLITLARYAEAEALLVPALEAQRRVVGDEDVNTLISQNNLALMYEDLGRYDEAATLFVQTLDAQCRTLSEDHPKTLITMGNLARVYDCQSRPAESEALFLETLERMRRVLTDEHSETLTVMNNLALLYVHQGRYDEAGSLWRLVLEINRRVHGEDHPDTLTTMQNLGVLCRKQGRYEEAEPLYLQSLGILRRKLGAEHPQTLKMEGNLALLYKAMGRYEEAETRYQDTLENQRRVLGPDHADTLVSMHNLAVLYDRLDRLEEAESLHQQTLVLRRRKLGNDHRGTALTMASLAAVLRQQQRYEEAEPLYIEALGVRRRVFGDSARVTLRTLRELIKLYEAWGRPDKADEYRSLLPAEGIGSGAGRQPAPGEQAGRE